jgi:hypothetical protein
LIRRIDWAYTLDLIIFEETKGIDENPRQRPPEVDEFVHNEGHDTRCKDIILHPSIPCCPKTLGDIEL